ncbi:unnamed protein product [Schistosoma margrebowiei]|uniref:Uncharacterized protein n=1 Tax=Schistosoma margrebowiei TaxID=48269 RepID=A0A183MNW9_9TREM|nr:unnamed protein product [Schistosoma margrebowiei]
MVVGGSRQETLDPGFMPLGTRQQERQNVTISNVKCVWCEEDNMRINSNDKNSHESKVADHRIKVSGC